MTTEIKTLENLLITFLKARRRDMLKDMNDQYAFYNYQNYFLNDKLIKMLCMTQNPDQIGVILDCVTCLCEMYQSALNSTQTRNVNLDWIKFSKNVKDIQKQLDMYSKIDIAENYKTKTLTLIKIIDKVKGRQNNIRDDNYVDFIQLLRQNFNTDFVNKFNNNTNNHDNIRHDEIRLIFSIVHFASGNDLDEKIKKTNIRTIKKLKQKIIFGNVDEINKIYDELPEDTSVQSTALQIISTNSITFSGLCKAANILSYNNYGSQLYNETALAEEFYRFDDNCNGKMEYGEFKKWLETTSNDEISSDKDNTVTRSNFKDYILSNELYENLNTYLEIDKQYNQEKKKI